MEYASLQGGGGGETERFYQEPNPPNVALNKNEIDKARRSHHRKCNIRQTGDLQYCSPKYHTDVISAHWLIFRLNLEDSTLAFPSTSASEASVQCVGGVFWAAPATPGLLAGDRGYRERRFFKEGNLLFNFLGPCKG